MKKTNFLFVNKTASSVANKNDHLTHSVGAQRSAIQRHVQNGLARPRRPRRPKPPTQEEPILLDDRSLYNPTLRHIACKLDAFNTACVHLDATVQFLLHYYIFYYQWTIMTNAPLPMQRQPQAFKNSVVPIVHVALEDELIMHCLLATAVCRVRYHDGMQYPSSTEDHFMSEALRLLQNLIGTADFTSLDARERLVTSILFLGIAESFRRNYAASRIHLGALLDRLGPSGVAQLRDRSMQEQLLLVDLVDSSIYLTPCRFVGNNDPGPAAVLALMEQELSGRSEADILGSTLLMKGDSILPAGLRDLVIQILEIYDVKCRLKTPPTQSRGFEITQWMTRRNRAIWKRLLDFVTFEKRVQALRAALIMWCLLCFTITARVRTIKEMAVNLKSLVHQISAEEWHGDQCVRLWILLMGYHCAEDDSETLVWFGEQIRRVQGLKKKAIGTIPRPEMDESLLNVFVRFQKQFLYYAEVQTARTVQLTDWLAWWDDLVLL